MPCSADDLRLLALDRRDRPVDAERRRLDRVTRGEWAGERKRLVELPDCALRPDGVLGGGSEPAVASRLVPAVAPSQPDLGSKRVELGPRGGQVALRVRRGALPLGRSRRLDGGDLVLERPLPLARALERDVDLGALRLGRRPLVGRSPFGGLRLGEQLLDPEPLGRHELAGAATTPASSPSRSAIWSACDVPGRPSATR